MIHKALRLYRALRLVISPSAPLGAVNTFPDSIPRHCSFKWFSLPMLVAAALGKDSREALNKRISCLPCLSVQRKVIRSDVLIMVVVTVLVVFTNIVLAVGIGLGLSAAVHAYDAATELSVTAYTTKAGPDGRPLKTYEVAGPLFFAAARSFADYFSPEEDPEHVVVTFTSGGKLFDCIRALHTTR